MEEWEYIFEDDYFIEGIRDAFLIVFFPGPRNQFFAWGETSQGSVEFPHAQAQKLLDKITNLLDNIWKEYSRFERPGCQVFIRKPYKAVHVEVKKEDEDFYLM
jgi:hypothetical protein